MTAIAHHPHRVASGVADARAGLDWVSDVPLWSMDPAETAATLEQLTALAAQVTDLRARVLAAARRLASEAGVVTAVLNARSEVLDRGRMKRCYSEAQSIARTSEAGLRDRRLRPTTGCVSPAPRDTLGRRRRNQHRRRPS